MSVAIQGALAATASVFGAQSITGKTATAKSVTAKTDTESTTSMTGNTISASDFMTLLVTEMKNQDPTQPTDPTTYVQQLVGVNSLEQLVSINKGVTSLSGTTSTTAT